MQKKVIAQEPHILLNFNVIFETKKGYRAANRS